MKPHDLVGKRFGRLTILSRLENNNKGQTQWYAKCDCGKFTSVLGIKLMNNHTRSCGCLVKEKLSLRLNDFRLNLVGKVFSHLEVINRIENSPSGQTKWLCRCECGNLTEVVGTALIQGKTKSCGCLRFKQTKNEIGNTYGRLLVVSLNKKVNHILYWDCLCQCGNKVIVNGNSLRQNKTLSCGCLQKETASKTGKSKAINEIGNRYGKLIVLRRGNNNSNKKKVAYWVCRCDCGNMTNVRSTHLRNGSTVSCGCVKSAGELKIIELLETNHITYKTQHTFDDLRGYGNRKLKFDFAIFKDGILSYLIEYDGEQHYMKRSKFYSEKVVFHDSIKDDYALQKKIVLIRVKTKPQFILLEEIIIKD